METDRGAAVDSRVDLQKILREKVDVRAGGQKKPWVGRCPEVGSAGGGGQDAAEEQDASARL